MTSWIVITAPGSGIGQPLTRHLLQQGYGIIGMGQQNSVAYLESLHQEYLPQVHSISCDYTDELSMEAAFATAQTLVDRITGLIHLVGGSLVSKTYDELDLTTFKQVMAVNLDSAFLAAREASRWMKTTGGGNIILFGSTTGIEPSKGKLAYGVAKAGVHNLTLSLALEGSQDNILINTIAPSYVMTNRHRNEITAKATQKQVDEQVVIDQLASKNPLKRVLENEEIFPIVDLLLTTTAMQGQIVRIDLGQVGI